MAKSPRKKLIIWLTTVVILVAVLVIGDRVAASIAGDKLSDVIAKKATENDVKSAKPPEVTMGGFPFLTQVIGGEYSRIDIELVEVGNDKITLPKLDIVASDVEASMSTAMGGSGPVTASKLEAEADFSYDSLTKAIDNASKTEITAKGSDTLEIKATVDVAGQPIDIVGSAKVDINENTLSVQAQDFQPDGATVPPGGEQVLSDLTEKFSQEIPLPSMPFDLKLGDPKFEDDHIALSASAKNVPLSLWSVY
ncbi:MAG: LmeA family phospholipid-binding protein [Stackebrandtia sp.]